MLSLTVFYSKLITRRREFIEFAAQKGWEFDEVQRSLKILAAISKKAEKNERFRGAAFDWLVQAGTLKLRDICKEAGFDYWDDLDISNSIDALDSFSAYFKK